MINRRGFLGTVAAATLAAVALPDTFEDKLGRAVEKDRPNFNPPGPEWEEPQYYVMKFHDESLPDIRFPFKKLNEILADKKEIIEELRRVEEAADAEWVEMDKEWNDDWKWRTPASHGTNMRELYRLMDNLHEKGAI